MRILRVKTQSDKNASRIKFPQSPLPQIIPQLKSMTKIFQSMKGEKKYDIMSIKQIKTQHKFLLKTVFELNDFVEKEQIKKKYKNQKALHITKNTPMAVEMGMDYQSLCKEVTKNSSIITKLYKQYDDYMDTFKEIKQQPLKQSKVQEMQDKIVKIRQQIKKHKRNKHLREKQIIAGDQKQEYDYPSQISYFEQQRDILTTKLEGSEQKMLESEVKIQMLKQECNRVYDTLHEYSRQGEAQAQHRRMLYETKKKKLALGLKGRQYQQHTNKRKYYGLLLQLQNCIDNISSNKLESIQFQIIAAEKQIQELRHINQKFKRNRSNQNISQSVSPIRKVNSLFSHQRISAPTGISMTQQTTQKNKITKAINFNKGFFSNVNKNFNQKTTQRIMRFENDINKDPLRKMIQNKLNKINVYDKKNIQQQTIKLQNYCLKSRQKNTDQLNSLKRHNERIKLSRRIHTEGSLIFQKNSQINENSYIQDFEQQQEQTEKE